MKTEADSTAAFNKSAEFTKLSPLGKVPAFEGANGYTLSEAIAIAVYGMYISVGFFLILFLIAYSPLKMMSKFFYSSYPWQNNSVDYPNSDSHFFFFSNLN